MKLDKFRQITARRLEAALDGFALNMVDGWNHEVLAVEIGIALSPTMPPEIFDPSRLSNADIRDRIAKLSRAARALHNEISGACALVHGQLKSASFKRDGFTNFIGFLFSKNSQYFRFHETSSNLSFVADFLDSAARDTERQSSKWRQSEKRRLRVWRGERLIPIFEGAFGRKITVNAWPFDSRHRGPTLFMQFYQRMVKLAFDEEITDDLSGVLKEARKSFLVGTCDAPESGE